MKGKDPIHAAQHFLEENPTDFVVLAAHTHKGRMRWGRGKVLSQPIASASEAAALFVPYGSEGFVSRADGNPSLKNVLIPVDSTPSPAAAIEAAQRLTWALQCPEVTFTLLHVGKTGEMPSVKTEEQDGWTWRKLTRDGEVVDTILSTAKEVSADLIVMTTAGRDGFLDGLRGSTTERVLRGGMVPVLAIPAAMDDAGRGCSDVGVRDKVSGVRAFCHCEEPGSAATRFCHCEPAQTGEAISTAVPRFAFLDQYLLHLPGKMVLSKLLIGRFAAKRYRLLLVRGLQWPRQRRRRRKRRNRL
jgi:hypothetical protein